MYVLCVQRRTRRGTRAGATSTSECVPVCMRAHARACAACIALCDVIPIAHTLVDSNQSRRRCHGANVHRYAGVFNSVFRWARPVLRAKRASRCSSHTCPESNEWMCSGRASSAGSEESPGRYWWRKITLGVCAAAFLYLSLIHI